MQKSKYKNAMACFGCGHFSGETAETQINALTYPRRLSQEQNTWLGIHGVLPYLVLFKS